MAASSAEVEPSGTYVAVSTKVYEAPGESVLDAMESPNVLKP
jgi:hypothetical protein